MDNRTVKVKIIEATASFISFKYISSNARSRVRSKDFITDYQAGKIDVSNPELLDAVK